MSRSGVVLTGTVLLVGVLHLLTLRPGHEWGDDFSLYLAHARNLAEGRPYEDTGYVYNPHFPALSPRTYPPVFPLLLAPVYAVFGMDLMLMKAYVVLLFTAFMGVLAVLLRRHLPVRYVVLGLLLVGLNPFVWQHKDRLMSEAPFLFFAYLSLVLMEQALALEARRPWVLGALAGVAAYLAFGTRPVGIVLVPSLMACEILPQHRPGTVSLAALVTFSIGVIVQGLLFTAERSVLDQLMLDLGLFARTGASLVVALGRFVENGYSAVITGVLYACLLLPACAGFVGQLREKPTACEPFFVASFLLLVFWPSAGASRRYLLPLIPLFFLYVFEGLLLLGRSRLARIERPAALALGMAILMSYAAHFTRIETGPVREGVTAPETTALFDYIRSNTNPSDVFLFQKPRALALFTGRRASAHHAPPNEKELWDYLHSAGITHVILCRQFKSSQKVLEPFVAHHADQLRPVYGSKSFTVYRVIDVESVSRR